MGLCVRPSTASIRPRTRTLHSIISRLAGLVQWALGPIGVLPAAEYPAMSWRGHKVAIGIARRGPRLGSGGLDYARGRADIDVIEEG